MSQSPPALYTPGTREGSVSSENVRTPSSATYSSVGGNKQHDRGLSFSVYSSGTGDLSTDDLFSYGGDDDNDDDSAVPLFQIASPHQQSAPMAAGSASPIDITTSRQSSGSPRSQQSNLTSQLQQPRIDVQHDGDMTTQQRPEYRGRQESVGMLGTTPYGARSIPMRDNFRRESNALSGSMVNGMSWGGISVGSYIRDEYVSTAFCRVAGYRTNAT
jgi:hypothetical protein